MTIGVQLERREPPEDPLAHSYGIRIGDLNGDRFPVLVFANSESVSRIDLNATPETAPSMLAR